MTQDETFEAPADAAGGGLWSPERAAAAMDLLSSGVLVLDGEGRIVGWNAAAQRLLALADDEHRGQPHEGLVPEDNGAEHDALRIALSGYAPAVVHSHRQTAWGERIPVQIRYAPVPGGGAVVVVHDESRMHELTAVLQSAQRRAEEIQRLARMGQWVWDEASDEIQWSAPMYQLMETSPLDFDGDLHAHLGFVAAEDRPGLERVIRRALDADTQQTVGHWMVTGKGRRIRVETTVRPLQEERLRGIFGVSQDVSEQQRNEEHLLEANQMLERFASTAAHDLKSPLAILASIVHLLQARYAESLDDQARMLMDRMGANLVDAQEMIDGLVRSARTLGGGGQHVPVPLAETVAWVQRMVGPSLAELDAELEVGPLPTVHGDPALLRQLFLNLISNAIKYRDPSRRLRVEVAAETTDGGCRIVVRDNGLGIPPEKRSAVFGEGVRIHGEAGVEGHGMGLAACRAVVRRHGGRIIVEDGIDGGSAFVVFLPVDPADAAGVADSGDPVDVGGAADSAGAVDGEATAAS